MRLKQLFESKDSNMVFESKDQLDISILSASKVIKTKSDIESLLNTEVEIEHKTDGTKLTVLHINDNGDLNDC